jgi:hypothetical protein
MEAKTCNTRLDIAVNRLDQLLNSRYDPGMLIDSARCLILTIGSTPSFGKSETIEFQTHVVDVLQRIAYYATDVGPVVDIADWCLANWLRILQPDPHNTVALKGTVVFRSAPTHYITLTFPLGIGQWWLAKAQPCLSRIHAIDGSSSSSEGSRRRPGSDSMTTLSMTHSQEEQQAAQASVEAEARLHTADYVEARGILLPATEYLRRAVDEAERQHSASGHLLITVSAKAFPSPRGISLFD